MLEYTIQCQTRFPLNCIYSNLVFLRPVYPMFLIHDSSQSLQQE